MLPAPFRVISLPFDSSFVLLTACVAMTSIHPHGFLVRVLHRILAGEEGFEPPYPVLETGVLTVGRLPFTVSPISGRRVIHRLTDELKLLFPAPALQFLFPSAPSLRMKPLIGPSLCFLVRRVLAARATKLLCLHALRVLLLVFGCGVVPVLALTTLQRNDFPHFLNSFLQARAGLGQPACAKITRRCR